jgi:uncharacterized membrane protein
MTRSWFALGVLVCTAVAAAVRVATLGAKSFWVDEAVTVSLVDQSFGAMLRTIPNSESTPYLYYVLAWLWAQLFGVGEAGLRSLPALLGSALVPVTYLAGRELGSRRVGLAAAALVAVNPLLVWYSQEARAYALLVLLAALATLFFFRALNRGTGGALVGWAITSAAALATHYFALFLVVPEALFLIRRFGGRRAMLLAIGFVAAVGLSLLPMALQQLENPRWIAESGLASRLAQIPAIFLIGFEVPVPWALVAATVAGVLAAFALWLLVTRADSPERGLGLVAAAICAATVAVPAVLSFVGLDYIVYKNVIAAVVPLTLAVAVGLTATRAGRAGPAALVGLLLLSAVITVATLREPKYHREDWRNAAGAIATVNGTPRAIVVTPVDGGLPLELYLGASRKTGDTGSLKVREIDLVAGARRPLGSISNPTTPRPPTPSAPAPGFALAERVEADKFTLIRYRSGAARPVSVGALRAAALGDSRSVVLLQAARR